MHLKIDELLRALDAADTRLVDLEGRSEKDLERLHQHYVALADHGAPPDQPATQTGLPPSTPDRPDRNRSRDRNVQKSQS
jgi:hypothetical protein